MKAVFFLALLALPFLAYADLYRWIDPESGSVKLSSSPPPWYETGPGPRVERIPYSAPAIKPAPEPSAAARPRPEPSEATEPKPKPVPQTLPFGAQPPAQKK